jgi:hypothetical protein
LQPRLRVYESSSDNCRWLKVVVSIGFKELQSVYQFLAVEAQTILLERDRHHPPRPTSPTFFNLPRTRSRARSNTSPNPSLKPAGPQRQFAASFTGPHMMRQMWSAAVSAKKLATRSVSRTVPAQTFSTRHSSQSCKSTYPSHRVMCSYS